MPRFAALFALFLLACSSTSSSTSTDSAVDAPSADGADGSSLPEPKLHRASPTDCPHDRPAGRPSTPPRSTDTCAKDADCTAGQNGRCNGTLQGNVCSYDQCFVDGDCGSNSVCFCRADQFQGANLCYKGNCRTDADCPGSWCSPSAVDLSTSCTGIPIGSVGYFCHVASDECTNDSDCGGAENSCAFDVDKLHWVCKALTCFG